MLSTLCLQGFPFIQVLRPIFTTPVSAKCIRSASPSTPLKRPTLPFLRSSDLFLTNITLQLCFNCTRWHSQFMLLDASFLTMASKTVSYPGSSFNRHWLNNITRIYLKNILCVAFFAISDVSFLQSAYKKFSVLAEHLPILR